MSFAALVEYPYIITAF